MTEEQKAEIEKMAESIVDEKLRAHVGKAVRYVGDAARHLIVANGIARAREGGYDDLALKLARLAYEGSPDDPYFLLEMCNTLGRADEVVSEIKRFAERVDVDSLPQDQRERIMVTLAEGYKEIGDMPASIKVLEELQSELTRATELLAEQYHEMGEPQKTIDLLYERIKYIGRLSETMSYWLEKSFETTGDYAQAMDILALFQDDASVKPIYDRARKELGLVVEDEMGRLPYDHPQPEDQRGDAERDLNTLF